ncbi:PAS domain S-box protein [Segetibacter sp. 3557_3]|uniref:PAS domain S-box protein n=1 Tax=Segetibacter sp. 3557_3 TaxID=2547429 RepID=UPI0014050E2D|nr:PAS domain S-box protein [Segetibacter sp. 3557_3]
MSKESSTTFQIPAAAYTALFSALPGVSYLLENNPPYFTILAVTNGLLPLVGLTRDQLIGKNLFEVFPSNPHDLNDTGQSNLLVSLLHVIAQKEAHQLPAQRYDIMDENGRFAERFWKAENRPVIASNGDVEYIIHTSEEITAKIKAEKREVEVDGIERAFGLFMEAPMVVGLVNGEDYVLELANKEAFKLWGKGPEIIGKPVLEAVPELAGQGVIELFDQVRNSGEPFFAHEVPVASFGDGKEELHYFNLVYQPYYNSGSLKATGVFTISHDITEQVKARQRTLESEERFRSMADASPVMIWTLDENGNFTYYNSRAAQFTGHTEKELTEGKSWQVAIHPDDIDFASNVVRNAVVNRIQYQMECRMQRADGEWRWLLSHGTPRIGKAGEYFGFVGSSIDITEHKKSQQELQNALDQIRLSKEAAELGTFDLDLEKGTMHWDDRCRTLFGISHHDTVRYEKDFVDGLHPDDRDRITKIIENLFQKSISDGDYDVEYRTVGVEDGIIRWVRAKGKVYFNQNDQPVRFIGSVLDITEKVMAIQKMEAVVEERTKELAQTNKILQQINNELQRSNQSLEEFAHAASHDLKEPVRKIQIFTQRLKDEVTNHLTETNARLFNRIENATNRMGNLIDDLLLYSHVTQRPLEKESIDLNVNIQKVLEDLELNIEEKNATIKVEQLPIIFGYRRQLQQLFQNLISNALKYSKRDIQPYITIGYKNTVENEKAYHIIVVKDNGIGFEPEYSDKIFQMFIRLHGKEEYSGTGVGLSIAKKVVQNHDGFIKVESQPGVGSTFKIYIPA